MANEHSIASEKILEKTDDSITLEFVIPESSDFFDGHFPEYKLLPAVAQFEVVTRFARKYFSTQRWVPSIRRIKFSAPIRPDTTVRLEEKYNADKGTIQYTISDANKEGKVYSTGSFSVLPE